MQKAASCRIISALLAGIFALSPASAWGKSAKEVFAEVARSVVVVLALDYSGETSAQGSGVVVGKNQVATNCHVIEDAAKIVVNQALDSDIGQSYRMDATILARDDERDLCLLFVGELSESPAAPIVKMGAAKMLSVGEEIFAIGAPKGLDLSLSRGVVSQLRRLDGRQTAPLVQTDAAISPGSSGGGLFNDEGGLVGITTFKQVGGENLNFAIPVEWVEDLWEKGRAQLEAKELRWAVENNELDKAVLLLEKGVDTNVKDDNGWTSLHWAARNGALEAVTLLIDAGADVNAINRNGETPMDQAIAKEHYEMQSLLRRHGGRCTGYNCPPPQNTATERVLRKEGVWSGQLDVNARVEFIGRPTNVSHLQVAAEENDMESARWLIANGANVNAKSGAGFTPLHMAALGNAAEVANLLIERGIDVNVKSKSGITPLHGAASGNAPEAARLLIMRGANVNAKNRDGETPIDWAIYNKHSKMQLFLHQHGGRCNNYC